MNNIEGMFFCTYSLDSKTSHCCFAGINGKGFQVNLLKSNIDMIVCVVQCIGCRSVYLCFYFKCNSKDKFKLVGV